MNDLPPYLFARIDEMKAEQQKKGVDIIDLGVGDPDLPTPPHIVDALCKAAKDPENHHYPSYVGMPAYRSAVADWYKTRFGVTLDAGKEVVALMGSKDGIAHIAEAFVNPGRLRARTKPRLPGVPDRHPLCRGPGPRDAAHRNRTGSSRCFLTSRKMWRKRRNSCTSTTRTTRLRQSPRQASTAKSSTSPGITRSSSSPTTRTRRLPTTATVHPRSSRQKGAMEVGIEMHSLSKTYNMTGWRIGMAVGNAEILAGLGWVKTNVDSGVFNAVQHAAIAALSGPQDCVKQACAYLPGTPGCARERAP